MRPPKKRPAAGDAMASDGRRSDGEVLDQKSTVWDPIGRKILHPVVEVLSPSGRGQLERAIETHVIPRLMTAHPAASEPGFEFRSASAEGVSFSYSDVEAFCELLVRRPYTAAAAYIKRQLDHGFPIEAVISSVLCSAARHLGLLWDSDRLTFVDVTVGLSRIQQLLRSFGPAFRTHVDRRGDGFHILLALVPGGGHTLGVSVVEEFFRSAGWDVDNLGSVSRDQLLDRVHDEWFDAVGLSAGGEISNEDIAATIALVRDASVNPHLSVVVGGYRFTENPDQAVALGADFGARDPDHAVALLEPRLPTPRLEA